MPTLRTPSRRHLKLLDALLLVASAAVGLAAIREGTHPGGSWEDHHGRAYYYTCVALWAADKLLLTVSAGWLLVRFRRPGPSLRRALCQPGTVACLTAVALHGMCVAENIQEKLGYFDDRFLLNSLCRLAIDLPNSTIIGRAILLAWVLLALGRRLRPEPGGIDRAGRALGLGWVAAGFLHSFIRFTM